MRSMTLLVALAALAACQPAAEEQTSSLGELLAGMPADFDELDPPVREQFLELQENALDAHRSAATGPATAGNAIGELGMWYQVYYAWDPDTAFRLYAEAAQLDPADARWPYYTGFAALKLGRLQKARAAFEEVLLIRPDDVAALVHLAEIDLQELRTDSALQRLEKARPMQPASARILGDLADAAFQAEDYASAIAYLQEALRVLPDSPQLNYKLALAYQRNGNQEAAERLFASAPHSQQVLDMAFDDPYQRALIDMNQGSLARVSAARQAMAAGNAEAAIRLAREGVDLAANRKTPLLNLASIYLHTGRFSDVTGTVDRLEAEFGPLPAALILRALAHERTGQLQEALADYGIVLDEEPENLQALIGAGETARRLGNLERALAFYEQAVDTNPGEVAPRLMRARALWHLGRVDRLRETLAGDVALHPDSDWLLALQARILVFQGDAASLAQGLATAVAAYRRQPSVFSAQTLAMGLAGTGRFDEAATWQQLAASSLFSTTAPGLYRLAQDRLDRINAHQTRWPAALDDFDTLNVPLDNPPPPPAL